MKLKISPIWTLRIGLVLVLVLPWVLTRPNIFESLDFTKTGNIGDTIGGITAPFLSLIGSYLVYAALKAQIDANTLLEKQINDERNDNQILQLYSYLNESINNFCFKSFPEDKLGNTENLNINDKKSGEAFYELFDEIYCREFHGDEAELLRNQSVSELFSILNILNILLNKLKKDDSENAKIILTLATHQFNYKIANRIRDMSADDFDQVDCKDCACKHGLPTKLKDIIIEIRAKI